MAHLSGLTFDDVEGLTLACEQYGPRDALLTLHVDGTELMLGFNRLTPAKLESLRALRALPRAGDASMYVGDHKVMPGCENQRFLQWHEDQVKRLAQRTGPYASLVHGVASWDPSSGDVT